MEDGLCDSALSLLVFLAWKRKISGSTVSHGCNTCFTCNKLEIRVTCQRAIGPSRWTTQTIQEGEEKIEGCAWLPSLLAA